MPRTKVKTGMNKRNRRNSTEDKLENQLRDLDAYVDSFVNDMDLKLEQYLDQITDTINVIRARTPKVILEMAMAELKKMPGDLFSDITMRDANNTNSTAMSGLEASCAKKKLSRDDEGYLTEEGFQNDLLQLSYVAPLRDCGPLQSALAKSRRRSKSMSDKVSFTPALQKSVNVNNKIQNSGQRLSRPKYRTPNNARPKAFSCDRIGLITPKVQPNMAMAILRHAKAGETVFSVTGSPVITSNITEGMANVNIPVKNGVLSLRATDMGAIDSHFISKIDRETIGHLRKLQANLNTLVSYADRELHY